MRMRGRRKEGGMEGEIEGGVAGNLDPPSKMFLDYVLLLASHLSWGWSQTWLSLHTSIARASDLCTEYASTNKGLAFSA